LTNLLIFLTWYLIPLFGQGGGTSGRTLDLDHWFSIWFWVWVILATLPNNDYSGFGHFPIIHFGTISHCHGFWVWIILAIISIMWTIFTLLNKDLWSCHIIFTFHIWFWPFFLKFKGFWVWIILATLPNNDYSGFGHSCYNSFWDNFTLSWILGLYNFGRNFNNVDILTPTC
jgi:hypothetical protein